MCESRSRRTCGLPFCCHSAEQRSNLLFAIVIHSNRHRIATSVTLYNPSMNSEEKPVEQDPRVYFAAERTFLAWIRTGLALMGIGFAVSRFGLFLRQLSAVNPISPPAPPAFPSGPE